MSHDKKFVLPFFIKEPDHPLKKESIFFEKVLRIEKPSFWEKKGAERALRLFHVVAKRVPAYKAFLKKHRVDHEKITTLEDFSQVPVTDKNNYIKAYSAKERSFDGTLSPSSIIAVSSGTSGTPTFWPRSHKQDIEAVLLHDLIYRHLFFIHSFKTLIVICFPMGVYVSGVATLLPTWLLSAGYKNTSCVSAGNNKKEVLRALEFLAPDFEQVVLVGHPFFVKDVLESAFDAKLSFLKKKVRALFCSEGFSEEWREYVHSVAGTKDPFSFISTYGSSEMLLMAQETPMSIMARKMFNANPEARRGLVDTDTTPSLFQYNPLSRFIETTGNKDLLFTSESGIPLVRFNLKDSGRVVSFNSMEEALSKNFPDWRKSIKSAGYPVWKLPFVSLEGRSDQTIIFYAANIYPENIKVALEHGKYLRLLTGKFTMIKTETGSKEQILSVHIELAPNVLPEHVDTKELSRTIFQKMKEVNREYADAVAHTSKDLRPRVRLWSYQHEKYFRPGLKPKYIER